MNLLKYEKRLKAVETIQAEGRIAQVIGLIAESDGPVAQIGELCFILPDSQSDPIPAEVVGFKGERILLMPLAAMQGIKIGSRVLSSGRPLAVAAGPELLGRILNGLGEPIDDAGIIPPAAFLPLENDPPNPLTRRRIKTPLRLGVRALDCLLTCGEGQRLGIFAGSGVGKSTLLGMIARNTSADINVIALIGERGREVRDFIERDLGEEGLKRSVLVVATSDQPALQRLKGAFVATAIAEYFRDQGMSVLFMMDSVTRFAMAQREIGLAVGEPPATKGYTPSVFALLPKLLERSGTADRGAITALYTVLVEGDDFNEPISDTVRGILDGHIILSRSLAALNHYPAIDVLESVSRLMVEITDPEHQQAAAQLREVLATYRSARDLINIGAYAQGSNPAIDRAMALNDDVTSFLRQGVFEPAGFEESLERMKGIFR